MMLLVSCLGYPDGTTTAVTVRWGYHKYSCRCGKRRETLLSELSYDASCRIQPVQKWVPVFLMPPGGAKLRGFR
jgi:hypothetical protein